MIEPRRPPSPARPPAGARRTTAAFDTVRRAAGRAIADFRMIGDGDRVMVCVSGGKDSHTLLDVLLHLQRVAPVRFELVVAAELGATRIALGHHADDALETLLLNLFHNGRIKSMPPRLVSDDGRHTVIRPLAYCRERDIRAHSAEAGHPIVPCDLCGSQPEMRRQAVKAEIRRWEAEDPSRIASMLTSLGHVVPSHLADRTLHDFGAPAGADRPAGAAAREDAPRPLRYQGISSPS